MKRMPVMVAYSFYMRFVPRIRAGLLSDAELQRRSGTTAVLADVPPKRQTIRRERKGRGHVRTAGTMQLYYHQRHPDGFLIGTASCRDVTPIMLQFANRGVGTDLVQNEVYGLLTKSKQLDDFASRDGFDDWADMRQFWAENHAGVYEFNGRLIRWVPT